MLCNIILHTLLRSGVAPVGHVKAFSLFMEMFKKTNVSYKRKYNLACQLYTAPNVTEVEWSFNECHCMGYTIKEITASGVSFNAILSCEIID